MIVASREEVLTGKDKERYDKLVLGEERYAWAFALRKIRELRRKGFDVEPTFDNPKKLKEFLHSLLRTYEKPPGQELFETLQEIIKSKSLEEIAKKVKKS